MTRRLDAQGRPVLVADSAPEIVREVRERAPAYVPEWLGPGRRDDAGEAFTLLYAGMARTVGVRLNQLPDRAYREYLRAAGIGSRLGTPASTLLQFQASRASRSPVFVAKGFRVGGAPAEGESERVVFETTRDLYLSGGSLDQVVVKDGPFVRPVTADDPQGAPFETFPASPAPGQALWLGISADRHPGTRLSLAFRVPGRDGTPPSQSAGGLGGATGRPLPTLGWAIRDKGTVAPGTALFDDTAALTQSGTVELRLPASWSPGPLPGVTGPPRYWLRLRVERGEYQRPVLLQAILLDAVPGTASATFRNEILERIDDRVWRLANRPVVPGTLTLTVEDTAARLAGDPPSAWTEVSSLEDHPGDARVYLLDAEDGVVRFGDGVHGAAPPIGFRHVRAERYRVSYGASSRVDAEGLNQLLDAAPLVLSVRNPVAASGGRDPEPLAQTLRRGPAILRARGRAVAPADYADLALQAPGARVRRAVALPGFHPEHPGASLPGLVGVLVVGEPRSDGPPIPDEPTLAAVARHLAGLGPLGVEVVAASMAWAEVTADVRIGVHPDASAADVAREALAALDRYLDPLVGGEGGTGFEFDQPIRYNRLLQRLLAVPGLTAVSSLDLTVDGERMPRCSDVALAGWRLPWPGSHAIGTDGGGA